MLPCLSRKQNISPSSLLGPLARRGHNSVAGVYPSWYLVGSHTQWWMINKKGMLDIPRIKINIARILELRSVCLTTDSYQPYDLEQVKYLVSQCISIPSH